MSGEESKIRFDYVECSERLRSLRQSKHESHAELGKSIRVSEQTLKNYEQAAIWGETTGRDRATKIAGMSINTLCQLADHYGVSTDYLLGRSEVKSADTNLQAVCDYTGLTETSVKNLTSYDWNKLIYSREDYESPESEGDILKALNSLLSADAFYDFLIQVCMVQRAIDYAQSIFNSYTAGALQEDEEYDSLVFADRELRFSLYELSNIAREMMDIFGAVSLETNMKKAIRKIGLSWVENQDEQLEGVSHGERE